MQVECGHCGHVLEVPPAHAGREVLCSHCGVISKMPGGALSMAPPRLPQPKPSQPIFVWVLSGVLVLVLVLFVVTRLQGDGSTSSEAAASGDERESQASSQSFVSRASPSGIPIPVFPGLGPAIPVPDSAVKTYFVDLGKVSSNRAGKPGMQMAMRIYLPPGSHDAKSIPCVLMAPAGTNLMTGNSMDAKGYHAESLPYAEAGMAVVFYSIDGALPSNFEEMDDAAFNLALSVAYHQFSIAKAGVVNGRNALEFVLQKLPMVDPDRIYSAGHSSAATLSLLFAAHEPRLAACVAYAGATDISASLRDVLRDPISRRLLTDLSLFAKWSSPDSYVGQYEMPVYLFHAEGDGVVPARHSIEFGEALEEAGKNVTLRTTKGGNHYDSMISVGIPGAIKWLRALPTK